MLMCPHCKERLNLIELNGMKTYKCINNHSYDVSKYGYVNLVLNAKTSGDNKEMIESRHAFLSKDYYLPLANKISDIIKSLSINNLTILDIGCGEGYYDRLIQKNTNALIYALDISKEAILKASKQEKSNIIYLVASSYHLPIISKSINITTSIFSPISLDEIKRVTTDYFIKVIPNDKHLIELKEDLYKDVYLNEVKENINLELVKKENLEYKMKVDDMDSLFKMTPYYYTTHNNFDKHLESKDVTFSFVINVYKVNNNENC